MTKMFTNLVKQWFMSNFMEMLMLREVKRLYVLKIMIKIFTILTFCLNNGLLMYKQVVRSSSEQQHV